MTMENPRDEFHTETAYNDSFDQVYGWTQNPTGQPDTSHQQMVPMPPSPPAVPVGGYEELQRDRDRRAMTLRVVIALALAVPLTAIATVPGGVGGFLAMAMTWCGIIAVVALSSGRGFPRR